MPRLPSYDALVAQILFTLRDRAGDGTAPEPLLADSLVLALIVYHSVSAGLPSPAASPMKGGLAPWRMKRVVDYVEANLETPITLVDMAKQAGLHHIHFSRAFKQSTGMSPHRWRLARRAERARQLLADRKLSLAQIALMVGFSSQAHFTTAFR